MNPLISIILPCRNEERSLAMCINRAYAVCQRHGYAAEIIVSDSSVDRSPRIAQEHGARLIKHDQVGYGTACREGFAAARGTFLFLADADGTYDFEYIPEFVQRLERGDDLVIGNRFAGTMDRGAMPWLNRYLGNPILSFLFRLFFRAHIRDVQCGMRALRRDVIERLGLKTTGMEFASEMMIKAVKLKLRISEVPITYHRRAGQSKLRPWADGWRHLRFMLLYSPLFLFFLPGLVLFVGGTIFFIALYTDTTRLVGLSLQYHPLFLASSLIIVGYQLMIFALFAKTYAVIHLDEYDPVLNFLHHHLTIEKAGIAGLVMGIAGAVLYGMIFWKWFLAGFGELHEIKNAMVALTLAVCGTQTFFSAFMLSILGIEEKK